MLLRIKAMRKQYSLCTELLLWSVGLLLCIVNDSELRRLQPTPNTTPSLYPKEKDNMAGV